MTPGWGSVGLAVILALSAAPAWAGECLPFFDYSSDTVVSKVVDDPEQRSFRRGDVDITPEPIAVSRFGEEILRVCGGFGSKVKTVEVTRLIKDSDLELFKELLREFPQYDESELRDALVQAWTGSRGFEHIFCGQKRSDKIGGLHYFGRYFQLQQEGQLCRLTGNIGNEEIYPGHVYTLGVATAGVTDKKKGYSTRQNAEEIFYEASRAYLRNCLESVPDSTARNSACLSRLNKDSTFVSKFVCAPGRGIVTFYPLAANPRDSVECR
ncbi:MAG: EndoU domain-containing protein [Oligoflexia bacterium]|nr:EndoU domain-containing protein [Oligoflexia bacterium]